MGQVPQSRRGVPAWTLGPNTDCVLAAERVRCGHILHLFGRQLKPLLAGRLWSLRERSEGRHRSSACAVGMMELPSVELGKTGRGDFEGKKAKVECRTCLVLYYGGS